MTGTFEGEGISREEQKRRVEDDGSQSPRQPALCLKAGVAFSPLACYEESALPGPFTNGRQLVMRGP